VTHRRYSEHNKYVSGRYKPFLTGKGSSVHLVTTRHDLKKLKFTDRSEIACDKLKGKVVPVLFFLTKHHAMQAYWGSGGIAPLIL
jgi:hypothetical protein